MINGIVSSASYIQPNSQARPPAENTQVLPQAQGLADNSNANIAPSTPQTQRPVAGSSEPNPNTQDPRTSRSSSASPPDVKKGETNAEGLTPEEEKIVQQMKQRDAEVRAHEQAHKSAGGAYTSSASFTTETGPDGQQYAVGGEVQIDTSPVANNPEATISKMAVIVRAALAPAEPSSQDQQVAQQAQQTKLQAQAELNAQRQKELQENTGQNSENATPLAETQNAVQKTQSASSQNDFLPLPKEALAAFDKAAEILNPLAEQTVNFAA